MMFNNIRYTLPLHLVLLLTNWLPDNIIFLRFRGWLAHFFIKECGKDLRLGRNISFYNPANISIGDNVYIAYGNWFSADAQIVLENEVIVGPYCVFASSNHSLKNESFRYGPPISKEIIVKKGVWLGAHCTITAGTYIDYGCCIAANTITRGTLLPLSIYGGVPCRLIKPLKDSL